MENIEQIPKLSAEHIHTFFVPPNEKSTVDAIIVIEELTNDEADYGNGIKFQSKRKAQLSFYYPPDYTGDMASIEKSVEDILLNHRVRCYSDAGHVLTPDSQNIINTLKFNYIEEEL